MPFAPPRIGKSFVTADDESEYISRCFQFFVNYQPGDRPPVPRRNFSNYWVQRFETDWKRAFFIYTAGIPFLLANLCVAGMVKFWKEDTKSSWAVMCALMGLSLLGKDRLTVPFL